MHILNLDTPIIQSEDFQVRNISFFSEETFLDADIIFWNIEDTNSAFPGEHSKLNTSYSKQSILNRRINGIEKRKKELDEFFQIGRSLVITKPIFHEFKYEPTDDSEILKLDLIDCFDFKKQEVKYVKGKNINTKDINYLQDYYEFNKSRFYYDIKLEKSEGEPLMYIKDTNYIISEFYKVKNGLILVLPNFNIRDSNDCYPFLDSTIELIEKLKEFKNTPIETIPDWVNNYTFNSEKKVIKDKEEVIDKIEQLNLLLQTNNTELNRFKSLKSLFSSDGDTLEKNVAQIFKDFGFKTEEPKPNRDDLIIKLNDKIGVVEIKGLTKSAGEKHAAQLQKWVSTYHAEKGINPKGILIVNTFKSKKIEERLEKSFPDQMIPYSERMQHCLMTGIQLLALYIDYKENKISKKEVEDLIFETIGELVYNKNIKELFISE